MRRVPFKIRLRYSFLYHFHHVIIITIIIVIIIIIIIIFIIFSLCLSPFFSLPLSLSLALPSFPESVCEGFLLKISFGIRFLMIFIISSPSPSSSSYHHHHIIIIIVIIIIITHTSDRHIQIFISGLYIFTFAFRSSYFEITSCLHIFGSSSRSRTVLSYHLQDFIMQLLLLVQFYNLIYVRLQNFISPLSGQPSSSWSSLPVCFFINYERQSGRLTRCFVRPKGE